MEGLQSDGLGNPLMVLGAIVFVIGFILFAVLGFAAVNSASAGAPAFSGVVCGWVVAGVGMVIMAVSRYTAGSARIPPPPPIQQPMVPAGMSGPLALNCPACGAPAGEVDRFGVAVCTHCNTRYLVR